jgi:hypothetical protein
MKMKSTWISVTLTLMSLSKFSLCVLMTQCGKTFVAIEDIRRKLTADPNCVSIVFTMNTLLNNEQFAKRLEPIAAEYGSDSVVILSSRYKGPYRHVTSVDELRACGDAKVIIMCSHHVRYREGHQWIKELNELGIARRVHVYYDELHHYIATAKPYIEQTHALSNVQSMMGLTATPMAILRKRGLWSTIKLVTHGALGLDTYTGIKDMHHIPIDDVFLLPYTNPPFNDYDTMDDETIGFIQTVMERHPSVFEDGSRTFVPAHIRRVGHTRVREFIMEKCPTAVVVTINAMDKSIRFVEDSVEHTISLASTQHEVSERIANILEENGLSQRPLFMTGFLCVGMGQTLTHKSFGTFTHAIIGHMSLNPNALYQLFGRTTGRTKSWSTYTQTTLLCPTLLYNRIKVMERCALETIHHAQLTHTTYEHPMHIMPEAKSMPKKLNEAELD